MQWLHCFLSGEPPRPGTADLALFARLTLVCKSPGHLASPADLPTKVSYLANGTYRLVYSREIPRDSQLLPFRRTLTFCRPVARHPRTTVPGTRQQQLIISWFGCVRVAAYCDVTVEHRLLKAIV